MGSLPGFSSSGETPPLVSLSSPETAVPGKAGVAAGGHGVFLRMGIPGAVPEDGLRPGAGGQGAEPPEGREPEAPLADFQPGRLWVPLA